jgi:hypothetical protein
MRGAAALALFGSAFQEAPRSLLDRLTSRIDPQALAPSTPLALAVAALYAVGLMLAWPALGLVVGTEVGRWVPRREPLPILAALVVGLIVLHLVTHVPVLGGLVAFLGLTFGLGLIMQSLRRWRRLPEPVRAAAPVAVPA